MQDEVGVKLGASLIKRCIILVIKAHTLSIHINEGENTMTFLGKAQPPKDARMLEYDEMVQELHRIAGNIKILECNFNLASDHELVDYYILQLKAEQARQSYLLKKVRTFYERPAELAASLSLSN